jgi:hypothetical protein
MRQTTLCVEIDLLSEASIENQRGAAFLELRAMLSTFRRLPFTTNGNHEEIFITDVRLTDERQERKAPV